MIHDLGDGIQLNFDDRGSGRPLVLLPGKGLDFHVFDAMTDALVTRYRCITIELKGSGKSSAPRGEYDIPTMAREIAEVVKSLLRSDEGAITVGHSLGGMVAQQLAVDHPTLVRGLVLLSTSAIGRMDRLGSTQKAAAALRRTSGPAHEIVRGNLEVALGFKFRSERSHAFEGLISRRLENLPSGRGIAGQRAAGERFDFIGRLNEIRCPCVVIHGDTDEVISIDRGRELAQGVDGAWLVTLREIGHMPMLEDPTRVVDEIAYLSKQLVADSPPTSSH